MLTAGAVQAEEVALELSDVAALGARYAVTAVGGQVDSVADEDGAGGARAGQLGFPEDVLVRPPLDRRRGAVGHARPARAAELRPVGPVRRRRRSPSGREGKTGKCDG